MDDKEEVPPPQEIDFCTMGMFIIDEIHYLPPTPPVFDIIGGAGAYSALGARIFSPSPLSSTISWIVDKGSDFPPSITSTIESWQTTCILREDLSRLTTRGWNGYDATQNRAFKYTTPKIRLEASSLSPTLLLSKSFHLCCSPTRCLTIVRSILSARKQLSPFLPKPLFIWEPVPDLCTPSELLNTTNALPYIDILSPNHQELAALMGDPDNGHDPVTGEINAGAVERACEQLLGSMPLQSYTLVIRCGEKGCYVAKNGGRTRRPSILKRKRPANHARGGLTMETDMLSLFANLTSPDGSIDFERDRPAIDPGIERWLPAYFTPDAKARVVDPTGGGNGFLGGLAVGLARGKGILEAAAWGSVSASFCIEQVGVPVLGQNEQGEETWNGETAQWRLGKYLGGVKGIVERPALEMQDSFDEMKI